MRTSPSSSSSSLARLLLLGVLGLFVGCSMSGGGVLNSGGVMVAAADAVSEAPPKTAATAAASATDPAQSANQPAGVHSVLVQFCTSWGMARNYQEVRKFLEANYPELRGRVRGENYPIPPAAQYLGTALQFFQLFMLACVFLGDTIWNFVPFVDRPPAWYYGIKENGMAAVIVVFLVVPTLVQNMTTSGAFEIVMDDGIVLYSKLHSGRMPNGNDIIEAMAKVGMKMVTAEQ